MDNQLPNAAFPVMLCRRDCQERAENADTTKAGLLKAAQRRWELQAKGPPLVQLAVERVMQSSYSAARLDDGNVFLKCVHTLSDFLVITPRQKK
jgi:hypothetical protein